MGFDAFLKIDGIKGESQDSRHRGEIEVLSFNWEAAHSAPTDHYAGVGIGHGQGKVSIKDFSIVKKADASTPLLFLYCANGTHIKEANFVVRKAGGEQLEYLKFKFTTVLISSYKPHGEAAHVPRDPATGQRMGREVGGDEIPLEELCLRFAKVEVSYQPQGPTGSAQGSPIMAGWDVQANKKI